MFDGGGWRSVGRLGFMCELATLMLAVTFSFRVLMRYDLSAEHVTT